MKGLRFIINIVAVILVFFGVAFKIMHWPGAATVLVAGISVSFINFLVPSKKSDKKIPDDNILDDGD